jgi:3-deoxy-D-manno-octulosonate 8-phosphate phosphatase (KDO 8-P phosphatase)
MEIFLGVHDKIVVFNEYLKKHHLDPQEIIYMGDDIPDYQLMQLCGIKTCPSDACEEIKSIVDYISFQKGGDGCARDIIEQTLKAQGRWMEDDAHIW